MSACLRLSILVSSSLALAACDTTTTPSYQTSPQNTIALMEIASVGGRASAATVSAAPGVDTTPTCRLMGALDIGGGNSAEQTLQSALQAELLAGGVYAANGTPISIVVTEFSPNSFEGTWKIAGTVKTPRLPEGYAVQSRFDYKTSFTAYSACNNTALAFNNAAANFINAVVTNPKFRSAIQ